MNPIEHILSGGTLGSKIGTSEYMLLMEPTALRRQLSAVVQPEDIEVIDDMSGPVADMMRAGVPISLVNGTAIIPMVGLLNKRIRIPGFASSYIAASAAVRAAATDKQVRNIMLKIDSPGGFVSGVAEAADEIRAAAQTKRTVAQVDGLGAAAAYWLASQANEVVAGRLDKVGSIGVLAVIYDTSGMAEQQGVKAEVFTTGKYKAAGVPGTSLTEEQRKDIQAQVDSTGEAFIRDIARGRNMDVEDVRKVADGRVFGSAEALSHGLVDRIGSFSETLTSMATEAQRDTKLREARLQVLVDTMNAASNTEAEIR